jgi:hypothetical protein
MRLKEDFIGAIKMSDWMYGAIGFVVGFGLARYLINWNWIRSANLNKRIVVNNRIYTVREDGLSWRKDD